MPETLAPPHAGATAEPPPWDLVIAADAHPMSLRLGEMWRYRDLLWLLARRDVVTLYKQTVLGPAWYILQPLLTALLYVVIFSQVARLSTDGIPPVLFYLGGVVYWGFFAESLSATADSFVKNADLFQKVYFPRAVVPAATVLAGGLKFAIQCGLLLAFVAYYALVEGYAPELSWYTLAVPALAVVAGVLGLGVGLLCSSLTYKYRDLQYLVAFGVQLLMYATPVIYPLSSAPAWLAPVLQANPMTSLVEAFRYCTLGAGTVTVAGLGYSLAVATLTLALGLVNFNRAERHFADTV